MSDCCRTLFGLWVATSYLWGPLFGRTYWTYSALATGIEFVPKRNALLFLLFCVLEMRVGRSMLWPHNAGAKGAALASGSASGGFQDSLHPGLPVAVRHGSSLPVLAHCRLSAGLRRRSSSAALCQLKDMCRQTDLQQQQLWRQMFCCCRSQTVEQSSSSSETNWH